MVAYAVLIFTLSSMSSLAPPTGPRHLDKVAHVVEYGLLGGLLARAVSRSFPGESPVRWVLSAVVLGGLLAALDERWQGTMGRMTSLADFTVDMIAVTGAAVLTALARRHLVERPVLRGLPVAGRRETE